jgi:6-pyruvoyltetrahydropterin/6-carboxytetrahydropterin synthase
MTTMSVTTEVTFPAGHRVQRHTSKCRTPHGHQYRVRVTVTGDVVEAETADDGMVIDFAIVKMWMNLRVHDVLDHAFIVEDDDAAMLDALAAPARHAEPDWKIVVFPFAPTAENLAEWVYGELVKLAKEHWFDVDISAVEVWETPTSCATFRP